MHTLLGAIGNFADKETNQGILKTLMVKSHKNHEKGALLQKYTGFYLYTRSATSIVPMDYKSRRFRYWDEEKDYFKKQYKHISELNDILHKKTYDLSPEEVLRIQRTCKKVHLTLKGKKSKQIHK